MEEVKTEVRKREKCRGTEVISGSKAESMKTRESRNMETEEKEQVQQQE